MEVDVLRSIREKKKMQKRQLLDKVTEENRVRLGWKGSLYYFFGAFIIIYGFYHLFTFVIAYLDLSESEFLLEMLLKFAIVQEPLHLLVLGILMEIFGIIILWRY